MPGDVGCSASIDVTFTITPPSPCSIIRRAAWRAHQNAPLTLTSSTPREAVERQLPEMDVRIGRGVVDEDVEPSEACHGSRDQLVDLVADGHVADRPRDSLAVDGQTCRGGLDRVGPAVGQQDRRTRLGEPPRGREAEPLRRPGDEDDTLTEVDQVGDRPLCVVVPRGRRRNRHYPHHSTSICAYTCAASRSCSVSRYSSATWHCASRPGPQMIPGSRRSPYQARSVAAPKPCGDGSRPTLARGSRPACSPPDGRAGRRAAGSRCARASR